MKKKFYKTVVQIEILSKDEPVGAGLSLKDIEYEITEGSCSGRIEAISETELTGKQAAKALRKQGSDPFFFRLDENGNKL